MNTPEQRPRNVILIGFMGTGKTTIGKRVAKSLGLRFVDTDQLVAKKAGKPIPKIFADDGEEAFRAMETATLRECASQSGQVLSTGGGIVTRPENLEILENAGYVIWLRALPETVYDRVRHSRNRPLLKVDDPLQTIRDLLIQRDQLYEDAQDLTIKVDNLTLEETAFGVTESCRLAMGV